MLDWIPWVLVVSIFVAIWVSDRRTTRHLASQLGGDALRRLAVEDGLDLVEGEDEQSLRDRLFNHLNDGWRR